MKLGIIKEGKTPPDKRVPLTPNQCAFIKSNFPGTEVVVQTSDIRAIPDSAYAEAGIEVVSDVSDCDVLLGVKEVPIPSLIPNKTYFFFSHTIKEQPYNQKLLRTIVDNNIRLIDYETITDSRGVRLIGFGRYAGIVGCYNGLMAYGKRTGAYDLKPAHECEDRKELEEELKKVSLPSNFKITITGLGRVSRGAEEILALANIKKVEVDDFIDNDFNHPVYTQLNVTDYNAKGDGQPFERKEFYNNPEGFVSTFPRFLKVTDLYVACHYWDSRSPFLFTRDDLKSAEIKTQIIADISCDIDGPVASTIRPSTIEDPLYGYNPTTEQEVDFMNENAIGVMAVDNLPCELPKDASEDFGNELVNKVLPLFLGDDPDDVIGRATIAANGGLTSHYDYLTDYLNGI